MPSCAWAQEIVFSQALPCSGKSTLAPAIQIDLPGLRDRFLTKVIISALEENDGYVPKTAKATGISPRTIYRLIPREKIAAIAKLAQERKRQIIIRQLELNRGNVSKTARDLKMHRNTILKFTSTQQRNAIRANKKEREKQELIRSLRKHCLYRGWLKNTAEELGIPRGTLRDKIRRHGIVIADIREELELKALRQEKGNVTRAARRLGLSRDRLSGHREEIEKLRRQAKIIEEEKRLFLLVAAIEELRGEREVMARDLGVSQKTVTNQLARYGKMHFPVLITERLDLMEWLLADIKARGLKAKEEMNMNSLRDFFSHSYERIREHGRTRDYPGWLAIWEEDLQSKFLPEAQLERIGRYKQIVKTLENVIGAVQRGRNRDMSEGIDRIVKVINTFYKQESVRQLKAIAKTQALIEQAI